jgi:tetratricopeptide (TPR) repeat protein
MNYGRFISRFTRFSCAALACVLIALSAHALAAPEGIAEAEGLFNAGKYAEALTRTNDILAKNPNEAQPRFLKALILTQQGKEGEAITIFTQLTKDFPKLAEPYNNLAALYAAAARYNDARMALEHAVRLNPNYFVAQENLGDVYAKLAAQQYDKVVQADAGNASARAKLKTATNLAAAAHQTNRTQVDARQLAVKSVAPIARPPATAANPQDAAGRNPNEVLNAVYAWADAWSARDSDKYLAFYGKAFELPKGQSRQAWTDERRARITGKAQINVRVESPQLTWDGNVAHVSFRQVYTSDQLKDVARKTLVLEKQDGQWRIQKERSG